MAIRKGTYEYVIVECMVSKETIHNEWTKINGHCHYVGDGYFDYYGTLYHEADWYGSKYGTFIGKWVRR